jgi:hypothetical protein
MRPRLGQVIEIRPAYFEGEELDQLGHCEATVVAVSPSGEDVLVRLRGTDEEWWVSHRRVKQREAV